MSARLTPMQVRQAAMRRNSVLTAMMAVAVAGGTYVYTMHAMSGACKLCHRGRAACLRPLTPASASPVPDALHTAWRVCACGWA
jgi:hypothetical protein